VLGFGIRDLVLVCTDCRGFLEVAVALDFQVFRCRRLVVVVDGSDIFDNVVRGNRADWDWSSSCISALTLANAAKLLLGSRKTEPRGCLICLSRFMVCEVC